MNLAFDTALAEDPLDLLFDHHRRIERQLAALGRLPVHLEMAGVDPEASAVAASALHCFGTAMPIHHEHEERDLLPVLERRITDPGDLEHFRNLRTRIEADHRELGRAWRELRRPLSAIAEGLKRELPEHALGYFRVMSALHISAEEGALHALARRHLAASDRDALARRMAIRRAATKRSSS